MSNTNRDLLIVSDYLNGASLRQAGANHGVGVDIARRVLYEHKVKIRGPGRYTLTAPEVIDLYTQGIPIAEIVRRGGGAKATVRNIIAANGVPHRGRTVYKRWAPPKKQKAPDVAPVVPSYQFDPVADAIPTPEAVCRLHFDGLESVLAISERYGIDRGKVVKLIRAAGRTQRGRGESSIVRMSKMSKAEKLALSEAAHDAVRGSKRSQAGLESAALSKSGAHMSEYERIVHGHLAAAGYLPQPNHPVGKWNVDIALPDELVAIEVDGGNWHTTPRKAAYDAAKEQFLTPLGWTIFRVNNVNKRNVDAKSQDLIARLKCAGFHPPEWRNERV